MTDLTLPEALRDKTVFALFQAQAARAPHAIAIECGGKIISYGALLADVEARAAHLAELGVSRGSRIAILSENRPEYLTLILAAALVGAIAACQNIRLAQPELKHCLALVEPSLIFASERCRPLLVGISTGADVLDIAEAPPSAAAPPSDADPEDPLIIIYTSGTTGLPKGAMISHRAEAARMLLIRRDLGGDDANAMLAWAPMYHIGGTDQSLAALMSGGTVVITDGFKAEEIALLLSRHRVNWLLLIPGMISGLIAAIESGGRGVKGAASVGCMADLVPPGLIQQTSVLFGAPFLNSFGMTETGIAPLSGGLIPAGEAPKSLSKKLNSLCEFRLIDPDWSEAPDGAPGEGAMRGPTLFSGYWNAPEANAREFREGWFRMGDLFRRNLDGTYDFVDRARYLIKSGGENIYPAEIERVLLADPRIADAVVVRKSDPRWGEVPAAFIAPAGSALSVTDVEALCRSSLAGFKCPKDIRFVRYEDLPRNTSGKILRHEMEKRLAG